MRTSKRIAEKRSASQTRQTKSEEENVEAQPSVPKRSKPVTRSGTNEPERRKTVKEEREEKEKEKLERRRSICTEVDRRNETSTSRDPKSIPFTDIEKRKEAVMKSIQKVTYIKEKQYITAENRRNRKIFHDEELRKQFSMAVQRVPDGKNITVDAWDIYKKLLERAENSPSEEIKENKYRENEKAKLKFGVDKKYRLLIMSNFTGLKNREVPVYCDITRIPKLESIPNTLLTRYTTVNVHRDKEIAELEKFFKKGKNLIKCDCHSREPFVKCYENPDCLCYKVNKVSMSLQTIVQSDQFKERYYGPTAFHTFRPIQLNVGITHEVFGFACSEECGCEGHCTNNVLMMMGKNEKWNRLILERKNEILGFQAATENAIPAGTPIAHFSGEICSYQRLDRDNADYAFRFSESGNFGRQIVSKMSEILPKNAKWSTELEQLVKQVYAKKWLVDPKVFGNTARMFNHSCDPSLGLVRVYQKGFAPSQMKYVAVTLRDVFPGNELSFDYGPGYMEHIKCQCGALTCPNTPLTNEFLKNVTVKKIEEILKKERTKEADAYFKNIYPKLFRKQLPRGN